MQLATRCAPRRLLLALPALLVAGRRAPAAHPAAHPAVDTPDDFAWQFFTQVNRPVPNGTHGRMALKGGALAPDVCTDLDTTPAVTRSPPAGALDQFEPMPRQLLRANQFGTPALQSTLTTCHATRRASTAPPATSSLATNSGTSFA